MIFERSVTNAVVVVARDKAYQYDANGNLTNDARFAYGWDEENRLVSVRDAETGALIQENRYDGLSRRREKVEYQDGVATTNRYLYADWLVLAVTDGAGNALETYTHGADLSGSVGGGAGGIGGILASTQAGNSVCYHYDFNGNIIQATDGQAAEIAKFTYSPFGTVLLQEGAFIPRFQFSTKEYDSLINLNYYGYRFYSPSLARWLNRDPLKENSFMRSMLLRKYFKPFLTPSNVIKHDYGFVKNMPLSSYDLLGLDCADPCGDAKSNGDDKGHLGGVVCCGGNKYSCVWSTGEASNETAKGIIEKCIGKHEDTHHDDIECPDGDECPGTTTRPGWKTGADSAQEECTAHQAEYDCYQESLSDCNGDAECEEQVRAEMDYAEREKDKCN